MPLTCPRCGAQNPDDMAFCQQCGSPLAASGATPAAPPQPEAPPPPPTTPPPPAPPPPVEPGPPGPLHRLPLGTILGILVGLLGLLAAGAIMFGHAGAAPAPSVPTAQPTSIPPSPTVPPPPPTSPPARPTRAPVVQPTSVPARPTDTEVPPPAFPTSAPVPPTVPPVQPTPAPPVQPTAAPPAPGGQTLTTSMFTLQVPGGWQLMSQTANEVVLEHAATAPNLLDIDGVTVASPTTVQAVLQALIGKLQQTAPDAQTCSNGQSATIGGVQGTLVAVCFTYTPQGSAAINAVALVWAATSASGNSVFAVEQTAARDNQSFFTNAGNLLSTLTWTGGP